MKLSMPKTFKPDPKLSAQSAQRIMKKADQQQANNPEQATDAQGTNKAMKAASTAFEAASYLPVGVKAKLALTAASMAADKLADSNLMNGQADQQRQMNEMLEQAGAMSLVALNRTESEQIDNLMQAQQVAADISKSVPESAQAAILEQQMQDRLQQEDPLGPRPV